MMRKVLATSFIMSSSEASPSRTATFLGGSFYSVSMLPPFWQAVSHLNPVLYLVSGFRWSFLRDRRRQPGNQPGDDHGVPGDLPGNARLDLQDRLPAAESFSETTIGKFDDVIGFFRFSSAPVRGICCVSQEGDGR